MIVEFLEPAENELKEAISYYNEQNEGLGFEFALEVQKTIERISQYPDAWTELSKRTRRCRCNRFPYGIIYYLKDDLLVKVDRASMKYSLEVRVPILDYRIIAFALNIHHELKIKNGSHKHILKQLLYKYCPQELFDRPKRGFAIPLDKWLKGDLKYLIDENLSETSIIKTGILNFSEVQKLLNQYKSGKSYLYNRIWNLIVLQQFLLKHNF